MEPDGEASDDSGPTALSTHSRHISAGAAHPRQDAPLETLDTEAHVKPNCETSGGLGGLLTHPPTLRPSAAGTTLTSE